MNQKTTPKLSLNLSTLKTLSAKTKVKAGAQPTSSQCSEDEYCPGKR